jgi:hypothetical protein
MAYKIAVGSSDGVNIDLKFGEVNDFFIYEADGKRYELIETRTVSNADRHNDSNCGDTECGVNGCAGHGHGCAGPADVAYKVEVIADCRCVVCKKIGFQAQKQFERKAISVFDVEGTVSETLDKITHYYEKIDGHMSLRG